jgi:hypothetical protein
MGSWLTTAVVCYGAVDVEGLTLLSVYMTLLYVYVLQVPQPRPQPWYAVQWLQDD